MKKKKLYKIRYELLTIYTTIISAKDEHQALKKFKKEVRHQTPLIPTILSFEEITM